MHLFLYFLLHVSINRVYNSTVSLLLISVNSRFVYPMNEHQDAKLQSKYLEMFCTPNWRSPFHSCYVNERVWAIFNCISGFNRIPCMKLLAWVAMWHFGIWNMHPWLLQRLSKSYFLSLLQNILSHLLLSIQMPVWTCGPSVNLSTDTQKLFQLGNRVLSRKFHEPKSTGHVLIMYAKKYNEWSCT
jgi:hypothetical protein